jgi:hypothetical protein
MADTCPYCNAVLPASHGIGRKICPRCGESIGAAGGALRETPSLSAAPIAKAGKARLRWPIAVVVLSILLLGAGILISQTRLRSRSTMPSVESAHQVIRPVDLPGLGYLPASSDVVLAMQMPLLLEKLGPEAEADPAKALVRFGLPETVVEAIEKASGVGFKNVDQLAVGIGLQKGSLPPQLVVVVTTRQPYDFPEILRKTKATTLKKDGRTLHVAKAANGISVHWWGPNNRVLIGSLQARDFDEIPNEPILGAGQFRAEIADLIRNRVAEDSCAWMVASSDNWTRHISPYVLLGIGPFQGRHDLFAPAERLRSVVVAIPQPAERPVVVEIDLKTADAADGLRKRLTERFAGEPIDVSGEGATCQVQTAFDLARVSSILSRLVQEKK